MFKLVTNDSSAYALAMLPYEGMIVKRGVNTKVLCIPFGPEIKTIAEVKEIVNDEVKSSTMKFYENSELINTVTDYTILLSIVTDTVTDKDSEGNDVEYEILIAKMGRSTTIPDQILELENQIKSLSDEKANLENTVSVLNQNLNSLTNKNETMANQIEALVKENESLTKMSEVVDGLAKSVTTLEGMKDTVDQTTEDVGVIKVKLGDVNEDELSLEDLKKHRISMSKINLAAFLEANPVLSTAHGGVEAYYTATAEKQNLLMAMIMMSQMNPDYQPSWNAAGQECTYDWTLEELLVLAGDIEAFVRPLVSAQQAMEVAINNAADTDEVKEIDITFTK